MSGKASPPPPRLPVYLTLVLILCAASLSMHLVAEGLAPMDVWPGIELTGQGGHVHPSYEGNEDQFLVPCPADLSVDHTAVPMQFLTGNGAFSISISPLLPPPNI
jgi:hypothetical protein